MRHVGGGATTRRVPSARPAGAEEPTVDPEAWIAGLAAELGVDAPSTEEVEELLALAGTAAHTSVRWVAPVSTWLVGAAGVSPADARATVERLAARGRPGDG